MIWLARKPAVRGRVADIVNGRRFLIVFDALAIPKSEPFVDIVSWRTMDQVSMKENVVAR